MMGGGWIGIPFVRWPFPKWDYLHVLTLISQHLPPCSRSFPAATCQDGASRARKWGWAPRGMAGAFFGLPKAGDSEEMISSVIEADAENAVPRPRVEG